MKMATLKRNQTAKPWMHIFEGASPKKLLIAVIKTYKKTISPYFIRSCRFTPTCSEYAVKALEEFGFLQGIQKAVWRILRCNPFSRGGFDPLSRK